MLSAAVVIAALMINGGELTFRFAVSFMLFVPLFVCLLFYTKKNVVPSIFLIIYFREYVIMVSMFFVVQVINNMAYNYNIPVTLHIIFRSVSCGIVTGKKEQVYKCCLANVLGCMGNSYCICQSTFMLN